YPAERLAYMLTDAGARVLLTHAQLAATLPARDAQVVCIDEAQTQIAQESTANPQAHVTPDNLVYVIYTSGSTGRPKGAMLTHRGVVNAVHWMQETHALQPLDRFLLKTSLSFDPSVWEVFWTLATGACIHVARPEGHRDSAYLASYIAAEGITTAYFVPSMLGVFLDEPQAERCTSLRRVICGGEALPVETMRRFYEVLPATALYHSYGPTEISITASAGRCEPARTRRQVSMGYARANTSLYVLDAAMQPVPVGVAGELYIGGVGLGRGYLHRPELTAERFMPDPFSQAPGARLYRTGDVVRRAADGSLEFVGRIDSQVKVRGFRIELGEIESVLRQHPGVRACVVQAHTAANGGKGLVAYVVGTTDQAPGASELRTHLKTTLPDYMLPGTFVLLDALPLTPNGKVDRKALPAPEADTSAAANYRAPRTPVEEVLAGLWAGVLGVARIGVDENFFDLGGHSLLAAQLIARVRESFRIELPLRTIFETPTMAGLGARIEQALRAGQALAAPPLMRVKHEGALPLSFAQQRLWFLHELAPESAVYHIPLAVRLIGQLEVAALSRALSEVVRRHEALRTTFTTVDGEPVQIVVAPSEVPLPLVELHELPAAEREAAAQAFIAAEAARVFDLARGPMLRCHLLKLAETEHIALLTMHHIVSDGWSTGVLVNEVAALYAAYTRDLPSPLAELPVQYGDYSVWQRDWLQGAVLDEQLAYWRKQLADAPPLLELPTDRPRPVQPSLAGASVRFELPLRLTEDLRELSRRAGSTLFMTLLAAWQGLLARYSGQTDITVGTPIAHRTRVELEQLIGFFVNTLVLRTDLSGDPTFSELLSRVREVTLGA
ncbi:MAG TPA: amino acid adenylation domain-containing protein, partial [Pyrinomonadaceae bacterium]|nr:amino acid adenylation domain-containing protein [Pyrinomonadaceae bacterium]